MLRPITQRDLYMDSVLKQAQIGPIGLILWCDLKAENYGSHLNAGLIRSKQVVFVSYIKLTKLLLVSSGL